VGVAALKAIDVQCRRCVIGESLEELVDQVDVELANTRTQELDPVLDPGTAGEINNHARQRFVQWHIGVAVAHDALLVAKRLFESLSERDAYVFDRMVIIDVQIAAGADVEIECAVACDLLEHVLEKRDSGIKIRFSSPIEIERDADPGFQRVAIYGCTSIRH
jgi:hypothetical protein